MLRQGHPKLYIVKDGVIKHQEFLDLYLHLHSYNQEAPQQISQDTYLSRLETLSIPRDFLGHCGTLKT